MFRITIKSLAIGTLLLAAISNAQATIQTINFDTDTVGNPIVAPSLFSGTSQLTNLYSDWGVTFAPLNRVSRTEIITRDGIETQVTHDVMEVAATGMGAILNDSSHFGNQAKSGDNFLAFNNQSASSSNFWRISFDNPVGYFGISHSNGSASTYQYLYFEAYDINGDLIGSTPTRAMGTNSTHRENYLLTSFASQTGISYIDIGHGMDRLCCAAGDLRSAPMRSGTWSLNYDDLIYGDFADAPTSTYHFATGPTFVPLPASVWLMLSGLIGILRRPNRKTP